MFVGDKSMIDRLVADELFSYSQRIVSQWKRCCCA